MFDPTKLTRPERRVKIVQGLLTFKDNKDYWVKKANLGCGPLPLYPQDARFMSGDLEEWLLVDLFVQGPGISNWDIEVLDEIPDDYLEEIFTSHALEHISHRKVIDVLKLWNKKLQKDGKITIIVPDLMYAFKQLRRMDNDQDLDGLYVDAFGLHSPLSIIYGTHSQPGEYHLGGFTDKLLHYALTAAGFFDIEIETRYEDHQMDCLIARATK
jgi:hypothetical protein